jgi:glutathione synthase/RimK-type ligase-like ATP-grasp enzyme
MKPPTLLGIYREHLFSPGKINDDAAIMDATVEELARKGWKVRTQHAESLSSSLPRSENVLNMAQSDRVLNILKDWSRQGTRIINTVPSIRNCYRKPLTQLLSKAGICVPPSRMITLEEAEDQISLQSSEKLWLKRGDVHAIEPGDVAAVTCREELNKALEHFLAKNIRDILVQDHVMGPVVKFYGVGQRAYFKAYLAASDVEVTPKTWRLWALAGGAARAVGLEVYGGDAVLTESNGPVLIDLNDWPSFSRCCQSAARNIAVYVGAKFQRDSNHASSFAE